MSSLLRRRSPVSRSPERAHGTTLRGVRLLAMLAAGVLLAGCQDDRSLTAPDANAFAAPTRGSVELLASRWIVTFEPGAQDVPGLARQIVQEQGGTLLYTYTSAVRGFAAVLPAKAVEALQRNPNIASIEADQVVTLMDVQSNAVWGLDRVDQRGLPLDQSYAYPGSGAGVNVYILDTGIWTTHAEFGGRASQVYSAFDDSWKATDCNGHGSHVAGTVGGSTYGVAKGVSLYGVRVLDCAGSGTYAGVIAGIDWVTANHRKPAVANMSLGGGYSAIVNQAVQRSIAAGVTYAVAAGNNASPACNFTPASTPEAITVAASNNLDEQASFSNYGSCVDLYAPGVDITSAWWGSDIRTAVLSGTSMATPHVAGVAALYLGSNAGASPSEVANAIVGASTSGVVKRASTGTPNRMLYSLVASGGSAPVAPTDPPPADTTVSSPPPPPPPAVDYAPFASIDVGSCPKGQCSFDASASRDDNGIVTYIWNFGDGSAAVTAASPYASHKYGASGTYTVSVTVKDAAGQSSTATATIKLKNVR